MLSLSVSSLPDHVLLGEVTQLLAHERNYTAALLARFAEIEARRLYATAGYHSMHAWCVGELHLSRDAAYRRIRAANAARSFPALFALIADGRLHLTAVGLLAPHLTPANFDDLVGAATHQDREAIELMLAHRFPQSDVPTEVRPLAAPVANQNFKNASGKVALAPLAPPAATQVAPTPVQPTPPTVVHTSVTPLSPGRYLLKGTLSQEALDLLNEAKALLAHDVLSGGLMHVIERLAQDWVAACKRRRQAATDNPRAQRSAGNGRYVPAEVQRAVRRRDGDRCTFVSEQGRRCAASSARVPLELDHVIPVAKGGLTTLENLRLRCRAHNQLEAEREFGREFMRGKREQSRRNVAIERAARAREQARALASPSPAP